MTVRRFFVLTIIINTLTYFISTKKAANEHYYTVSTAFGSDAHALWHCDRIAATSEAIREDQVPIHTFDIDIRIDARPRRTQSSRLRATTESSSSSSSFCVVVGISITFLSASHPIKCVCAHTVEPMRKTGRCSGAGY